MCPWLIRQPDPKALCSEDTHCPFISYAQSRITCLGLTPTFGVPSTGWRPFTTESSWMMFQGLYTHCVNKLLRSWWEVPLTRHVCHINTHFYTDFPYRSSLLDGFHQCMQQSDQVLPLCTGKTKKKKKTTYVAYPDVLLTLTSDGGETPDVQPTKRCHIWCVTSQFCLQVQDGTQTIHCSIKSGLTSPDVTYCQVWP